MEVTLTTDKILASFVSQIEQDIFKALGFRNCSVKLDLERRTLLILFATQNYDKEALVSLKEEGLVDFREKDGEPRETDGLLHVFWKIEIPTEIRELLDRQITSITLPSLEEVLAACNKTAT